MKKSIPISIIITLFFIQQGNCQKIRTLFYDDILYGQVKQVITINYLPGTMIAELTDTTFYDQNGITLEDDIKTMHGTHIKDKYTFSNLASGKTMQITGERDQNLSGKFDAKGNLAEYDSYLKNSTFYFKSLYEYDERNNLISFRYFDQHNSVTQKRTYKYDSNDRLISLENWEPNLAFQYHADFEYLGIDKAGNWTKRIGHTKLKTGKSEDRVVVRQITYY